MDGWHPRATRVLARSNGGTYAGGAWKHVWHTVESANYHPSTVSYYGSQSWPHATIAVVNGVGRIFQHIPITVAARALRNMAGGVQTNRWRAIQTEVAWRAALPTTWPQPLEDAFVDWSRWIHQQTGMPYTAPQFRGNEMYGANRYRLSFNAWLTYSGALGHQHAPEQLHWDPGAVDGPRLLSRMRGSVPPPPSQEEVDDMAILIVGGPGEGGGIWACFPNRTRVRIPGPAHVGIWHRALGKGVTDIGHADWDWLNQFREVPVEGSTYGGDSEYWETGALKKELAEIRNALDNIRTALNAPVQPPG